MDEQESTFDLAALEEGQEPLEEGPLPLPGFPAPPMPAEDAPPGEWDGPPRPEERASASDSESSDGQLSLAIGQRGAVEAQPPRPEPDAPPAPPAPPPIVEVEVVQEPVDLEGLSTSEVADRVERGAVNIEETEERTNWDIVPAAIERALRETRDLRASIQMTTPPAPPLRPEGARPAASRDTTGG